MGSSAFTASEPEKINLPSLFFQTGYLTTKGYNKPLYTLDIPNNITLKDEKYYQSIFHAVITLLGFEIAAEVNTNQGRIDCVLQTDDTIYIIEFKINDTSEAAMQQIIDNQYPQMYPSHGKAIVLLASNSIIKKRNIGKFLRQDYSGTG